ncbi:hypothetical protein [Brevibacillus sp. 1238]|uniref:hypothetical protein n=1 Tax=Brevibacillus sp. 1238 TaxID=2940565 RepID=UPI00247546D0|nr:hypothetical protein [Brevibacillus sp. 1238]MDH6351940.1 hypothetical protein [Brevibacillus sp. 1238]
MAKQNEAKASYVAVGRKQVIESTLWEIPSWRLYDPLAQTFLLTEERYVTALDLYFGQKDPNADVTVQLRTVANGYPSMTILTSTVVNAKDVKVSADGSVATRVRFPDPILLRANVEYAIVLLTPSSNYRAHVAKMGEKDLVSQKIVAKQPYDVGLLFSSSNASAWTAHQDMDLKFRLIGAKFLTANYYLKFKKMSVDRAAQMVLAASQIVPRGAEIQWQYSPNNVNWYALDDASVTAFGQTANEIYIRAVFKSKGSSAVVQAAVGAFPLAYKDSGTYISREITSATNFTTITAYVELDTPSGTNQIVEYTLNGTDWVGFGSAVSSVQIDQNFVQLKFAANVPASTKARVRIRQLSSSRVITPKARNLMVHLT